MSRTALDPIHLDGLFVPAGQSAEVAAPMVDFTKLDEPALPYLGASLTASPLSTLKLEAGVHLHWALPDALTIEEMQKVRFVRTGQPQSQPI